LHLGEQSYFALFFPHPAHPSQDSRCRIAPTLLE